jgi:hypothetical protein
MKARTINRAVSSENSNRSGHTGAKAAPHIDPISKAKVEATSHQLLLIDSTAYGAVALSNSRPIRTSALVSGGDVFGTSMSTFSLDISSKNR